MRIGQTFRYSRPYDATKKTIDGLPNYFHYTSSPGTKLSLLESGINPIQRISAPGGQRCPAILISSSPHKIGSPETPWQDYFDPDNGHVHYFGDNKEPSVDPTNPNGNKVLLEQFSLQSSPVLAERKLACPIIVFQRVRVGSRAKGNVQFQGFGIVTQARRVTQYDRKNNRPFSNYAFDFTLFSLTAENEEFSWDWITKRRDAALTSDETLKFAPQSWRKWVKGGSPAVARCRRRVVKLLTINTAEQTAINGSKEAKILKGVYDYYANRKSRFEALAAFVAGRVISANGVEYRPGWITPSTSDGGADFVGRLDVGTGLARAKIIVLGQAKCEKLTTPTGGNHIARTVARLRRGWIGTYVTTSYFSEAVQREVLEDKYPIVLVNGLRIAKEVDAAMHEAGVSNLNSFLDSIDATYDDQVMDRQPEELIYES
jgi:hypothetical protein